jgi:hypothetical protein
MDDKKEYGIEETMDMVAYFQSIADEMLEKKKDDGKGSLGEIITSLMTSAPDSLSAFIGANEIDDEMSNLSEEERNMVLKSALKVVRTFGKVFSKVG